MFLFLSAPWHTENPQRSKVTGEDSNSTGSEEKEGEGEVAGKDGTLWSEGRIVIIYFVMERKNKYLGMARVLDSLDCISCVNETLESGFV